LNRPAHISALEEHRGYSRNIVDAVKTMLTGMELKRVIVLADFMRRLEEKLKSCAEYNNLPDQVNKDTFTSKLADVIRLQVEQFDTLAIVEFCYERARLRETLLQEYGLHTYISAAHHSAAKARSWLDFLVQQQYNNSDNKNDPNSYICIIVSSGTGKTQLAATASLTYPDATTIYLNMAGGGKRFYNPHEMFTDCLIAQAKASIKERGPKTIMDFARDDDGTDLKSRMKGRKKFLVFLDEVPEIDSSYFKAVMCLRDTLRYLDIAPILMSTHTGAQDYVGKSSRTSINNWTWIISALPKYEPFPDTAKPSFIMDKERPLVLVIALKKALLLSETVRAIQTKLQNDKHNAWCSNPALQLVQLFCTDMVLDLGAPQDLAGDGRDDSLERDQAYGTRSGMGRTISKFRSHDDDRLHTDEPVDTNNENVTLIDKSSDSILDADHTDTHRARRPWVEGRANSPQSL
jgi:hypothetical protein